ncbi:glycosyltransferase [Flavobacteriaceae bacterium]|nr:glycosyltransferase [Flavobacteriaceae bacterium]
MILVDATYINETGGKTLLNYLIENIIDKGLEEKFYFLLDDRLKLKYPKINFEFIKASEKNRLKFYKKTINKFSKVFCFANVPPPLKLNVETYIYFHNDLLIDLNETNFRILKKSVFYIKRFYIKLKDRANYNWIVQTELIKEKLSKKIVNNKNRIRVLPFYFDNFKELKNEKQTNSFLYVSGFLPHKNHYRLIKAFVISAENHKENIFLNLTLKSEDFIHLMKSFIKIPSNLIIKNLGVLDLEEINLAYEKNQNLIFPSLKESFGLPLIEATLKNLNVITTNLDYVSYVIEPTLIFDPLDIEDISNSILKTLTLKRLKKPKLVSKNKVDELIKILTSV